MSRHSEILWTDGSWNPITGCTKYSAGCLNCYAQRLALRFQRMGKPKYSHGFEVALHPTSLDEPLTWKQPCEIFVCSMLDLFHQKVPDDFIQKVFAVMNKAKQHLFQILTKRSERLLQLSPHLPWTDNIWAGVTVENDKYVCRIDDL